MSVKIHFEITEEEYEKRFKPYIPRFKSRHDWAYDAFFERLNRKEGRDQKHRKEQLQSDKDLLRPLFKDLAEELGLLTIRGEK